MPFDLQWHADMSRWWMTLMKPPPIPRTEVVTRRGDLTPEKVDTFVRAIEQLGLPLKIACGLIGHPYRTVRRWLDHGEDPTCQDPLYVAFAARTAAARARKTADRVALIEAAAERGDVKGVLRIMEADDPDTWSPTKNLKVEVEAAAGELDFSQATDDELEQYRALSQKFRRGQK